LTLRTLFEFQDLVRGLECTHLIIDLSRSPYMDSAGLGSVLGAYTSCQRTGKGFALADVSPRIVTLLQLARVDSIVPRYSSVEDAERQFQAQSS
jgi:anti-sigma B factor antagonist